MITAEQIVTLAEQVRQAQKDYFTSRRYDDLNKSKQLERQLDAAIKEYRNNNGQTNLFGEGDKICIQ